jgi:hypothetical protein
MNSQYKNFFLRLAIMLWFQRYPVLATTLLPSSLLKKDLIISITLPLLPPSVLSCNFFKSCALKVALLMPHISEISFN